MDSNQLVALLQTAIADALASGAAEQSHAAIETLNLRRLRDLAATKATGLDALRRYLAELPVDADRAAKVHADVGLVILAGHSGNAEVLEAGESTVIASILPTSLSDAELAGKA